MNSVLKLLVIDDDEIVRLTLEGLLAAQDMEVILAEDGRIGLQKAQETRPDAILLDVMMPGMDGYETCRQLRADPALAEIPIIMVTALDDRDSRLTGLAAGADDFLTKPFDGLELQIRMKNIMRINRYRRLAAERSRFTWVVDNAEKGYIIVSADGRVAYANQAAQLLLHLPEDYAGVHFQQQATRYYQLHDPAEDLGLRIDNAAFFLVQPESTTAHAVWLHVEMLSLTPAVEDQRLLRLSDVTDQIATQQDLRGIHALISHKLRTPISVIESFMSILNADWDAVPADEIKPIVSAVWQNTERLVQEVHDMLTYIDAPIALADGAPFDLRDMPAAVESIQEALDLKDVVVSLPDHLRETRLKISVYAMQQICYELLENSKKFHPKAAPRVQVRVEPFGEDRVQLHFLDDGQRMTSEQIALAKLPYSQGEKWFTGEVAGMGLGIPLVASLVWQSGGQVRVANREDQAGVCVSLALSTLKV
jgi:DNA-binding response OmpR family regulator